jgi:hypothetical protein
MNEILLKLISLGALIILVMVTVLIILDILKIKYPLKGASVEVLEKEGQPGNYYAVVRIIPHLQLESINVSTRLVVSLPAKNN